MLESEHHGGAEANARPASRRVWFIVGLLTFTYLLSFVDRQILALLIEPIKRDLKIDDLRFSLLTGLAFSMFFALAGLPLGWAADTFRRNRVIAVGVLCWSIATIASGLSYSYGHIFVARVFVGVGEAALTPAAYSLMADIVAPAALGRAIAIFSMGSQFGAATAYLLGGALLTTLHGRPMPLPGFGELAVWQQLFVLVGLPGLLLAPVILMTVRDPRSAIRDDKPSLADTWRAVRDDRRLLILHFIGFTALAAALFAIMAWLPAVLGRRLGLEANEIGWTAGILVLLCCPIGTLSAGWLADRLGRSHGQTAPFRAALVGAAIMLPAMLIVVSASGSLMLLIGLAAALFVAPWPLVLATMGLQTMVAPRQRAQVTAMFLLVANLLGQTGGVSLVALGTQQVWHDDRMVHAALASVCIVAVLVAILPIRGAMRAIDHRPEPAIGNLRARCAGR